MNIVVRNGKVTIDGVEVTHKITVDGDLVNLSVECGDIVVNGNVGSARAGGAISRGGVAKGGSVVTNRNIPNIVINA